MAPADVLANVMSGLGGRKLGDIITNAPRPRLTALASSASEAVSAAPVEVVPKAITVFVA
jgi:hypothetical protein